MVFYPDIKKKSWSWLFGKLIIFSFLTSKSIRLIGYNSLNTDQNRNLNLYHYRYRKYRNRSIRLENRSIGPTDRNVKWDIAHPY